MTVKSMFDFKFPAQHAQEGVALARSIGVDMVPLAGYVGHEIVRDVKDPGHVMVNTHWASEQAAWAVLGHYQHDDKITRAKTLIGAEPTGFVGEVDR